MTGWSQTSGHKTQLIIFPQFVCTIINWRPALHVETPYPLLPIEPADLLLDILKILDLGASCGDDRERSCDSKTPSCAPLIFFKVHQPLTVQQGFACDNVHWQSSLSFLLFKWLLSVLTSDCLLSEKLLKGSVAMKEDCGTNSTESLQHSLTIAT